MKASTIRREEESPESKVENRKHFSFSENRDYPEK